MEEINGTRIHPDWYIVRSMKVCPMRWSWAMFWSQRVRERLVKRTGLLPERRLRDRLPGGGVDEPKHVEYVDNLVVLGGDAGKVKAQVVLAVETLRAAGLVVHEEELGEPDENDGYKRAGMVLGATRSFPTGPGSIVARSPCRDLERLVGHLVLISPIRREAVSCFDKVYAFMSKYQETGAEIWSSVKRELSWWDGLAPLLSQDMKCGWADRVYCADASPWGLGCYAAKLPPGLAAAT